MKTASIEMFHIKQSSSYYKALQKTEFSELFVFASFGIVQFSKFGNFSKISGLFELEKILQK